MKLPHITRYKASKNPRIGGSSKFFVITIGLNYKDDKAIYAHEYEHVRQWYILSAIGNLLFLGTYFLLPLPTFFILAGILPILSMGIDNILYTHVKKYKEWAEIRAYKKQVEAGGDLEQAILGLSSSYYNYSITEKQARELLTNLG